MVTISLFRPTLDPSALHAPRRRRKTLSPRALQRDRRHGRGLPILQDRTEEMERIEAARPKERIDCRDAPRPCLWVSCRFHLYLDVNEATGSLKLNFPDLEPWELPESCVLDIAERGGLTLEQIGALMNLTRERARQLETAGLAKMKEHL